VRRGAARPTSIWRRIDGETDPEAQHRFRRHKPDIVLADDRRPGVHRRADRFALSAAHNFPEAENNRGIGSHAADLLVSLVRNERGI
jgi:hypothetical protein